jgi:serine/threonine protein kinase
VLVKGFILVSSTVTMPVDGADLENCDGNPEMALQPVNGKPGNYNKMEFPRHDLEALRTLGNGSYGRAFLARASGIKDGERETMVVVKSLIAKDDILKEDFRREMGALVNMDNPHVVSLLGVCRDMDPLYMIFESLEKVCVMIVHRETA